MFNCFYHCCYLIFASCKLMCLLVYDNDCEYSRLSESRASLGTPCVIDKLVPKIITV